MPTGHENGQTEDAAQGGKAKQGLRSPLRSLSGQTFDVAIIGGGVNGATSAQHLAAEGYSVLMFDKNDFASGASSRSSRLLHCGLAGLTPKTSIWEYALHPSRFRRALRSAREQMKSRDEYVRTMPERVRPFTFCLPMYDDGPFASWQIDAGFRLLKAAGRGGVPLDYRRLNAREALEIPLLGQLRDHHRLNGVATFREYQFDWAERLVMDTVLDAERLGATVRNYTALESYARKGDQWELVLSDRLDNKAQPVSITARVVLNMAGAEVDDVNRRTAAPGARRLIEGLKGIHIMVRLAPEYSNHGVYTFTDNRFLYCVPWRDGLHYIGPTDTHYHGSIEDVRATEEDIEYVLANTNYFLPGLQLKRSDILFTWAGVQPRTHDPDIPEGTWSREIHDLAADGLPNFMAMTGATIGRSRLSGRDAAAAIRARLKPSGAAQALSYRAWERPRDPNSPLLLNHDSTASIADIRYAVEHEYAETLTDILFRRTGAAWSATMAREGAQVAAQILGESRGWTQQQVDAEVTRYLDHISRLHGIDTSVVSAAASN